MGIYGKIEQTQARLKNNIVFQTTHSLKKYLCAYCAALPLCFFFFSCVSAGTFTAKSGLGALVGAAAFPPEADVYVLAKTGDLLPVIIPILKQYRLDSKDINTIINKTKILSAAVFTGSSDPFVAALHGGAYPAFGADIMFTFSKYWKRQKSGLKKFWYSKNYGIAVDIKPDIIRVARDNPYRFADSELFRPALPAWLETASAVAWTPRAVLLNKYLKQRKVAVSFPARAVYAALFQENSGGDTYRIVLCVEAENEARAQSIQALLRLAKSALDEGAPEARRLPEIALQLLRTPSFTDGANVFITLEGVAARQIADTVRLLR
jgi:hypothetical protein